MWANLAFSVRCARFVLRVLGDSRARVIPSRSQLNRRPAASSVDGCWLLQRCKNAERKLQLSASAHLGYFYTLALFASRSRFNICFNAEKEIRVWFGWLTLFQALLIWDNATKEEKA